jgi:nucleoside-diphosphate-sugar epimerase
MRALIIGCGYVGVALARDLQAAGHEVHALRRHLPTAAGPESEGIRWWQGDITAPGDLAKIPPQFDWVVSVVSSSHGGVEEYEKVYLQGTRNILDWLKAHPPKKYVYTGSTSVYAQTDGSVVKETSPAAPETPTSRVLLQVEQLLLNEFAAAGFPAVIGRVAGIYGPDRGHLFQQYLKNEARIIGKGDRILNMIHRDDVAGIVLRLLQNGRAGEIYNVVDDEPVAEVHFFRWLSETLGKWMPPTEAEAPDRTRKRGVTNKKVSNRRIRAELGCVLKYPTFRQGYTAEILALERAGLLQIEPEER